MQTLQALAGFAAVLALMGGAAWLLRRGVQANPGARGPLALRASIGVGTRERVVLVEIEGTWLVLGVAPGSVRTLHTLPRGSLPEAQAAALPFAALLERLRR